MGNLPRVNRPLTGSRSEPGKALRAREARAEVKGEDPEVKGEKARAKRGQSVLPPSGVCPSRRCPSEPQRGAGGGPGHARACAYCSGGSLLSISGTWPGRSSLRAGHPVMSCTRSTTSRAAASTATRPGCAPPPGGFARAWPGGWARTRFRCRPAASGSTEARRQVLAEQAARRARDEAARARAADYPAQATRAREMLMRRSRLAAPAVKASPQAD